MQPFDSTVAALSTPPGKGGVALIRISGKDAVSVAERCFKTKSGVPLKDAEARRAVYGNVIADGVSIDDALATVFRAPASYTGEDMVEITTHGSMLVVRTALAALYKAGATPAARGEFTRRAFLNGRLSLAETEAIGELLDAKSYTQLRLFEEGSRTHLAKTLGALYEELATLISTVYAKIDYPDEDLADLSEDEIAKEAELIEAKCRALAGSYRTGRAIAEGIPTVLLGKPNTGKSSLYNRLCGRDAAIVTDIAGTTRDVLESTVSVGKTLLLLSDTAGVRETDDPIEKIGVMRSREAAEGAELVLALFDASEPFDGEDEALLSFIDTLKGEKLALLNKSDLASHFDASRLDGHFTDVLSVSVKDGSLDALCSRIDALFTDESLKIGEDAVLFSARQYAATESAATYLSTAIGALRAHHAVDAAAGDLELALGALAESDGRAVSEDIVSHIFSKFCVGK